MKNQIMQVLRGVCWPQSPRTKTHCSPFSLKSLAPNHPPTPNTLRLTKLEFLSHTHSLTARLSKTHDHVLLCGHPRDPHPTPTLGKPHLRITHFEVCPPPLADARRPDRHRMGSGARPRAPGRAHPPVRRRRCDRAVDRPGAPLLPPLPARPHRGHPRADGCAAAQASFPGVAPPPPQPQAAGVKCAHPLLPTHSTDNFRLEDWCWLPPRGGGSRGVGLTAPGLDPAGSGKQQNPAHIQQGWLFSSGADQANLVVCRREAHPRRLHNFLCVFSDKEWHRQCAFVNVCRWVGECGCGPQQNLLIELRRQCAAKILK